MSKENDVQRKPTTVLMGRQCKAKYKKQKVDEYNNNPLIEALPDIFTHNEVVGMFTNTPKFEPDTNNDSAEIRMHLIEQIKYGFMQPLPIHLELEGKISRMLRTGYIGRNPTSPLYARQFAVGITEILKGEYDEEKGNIIGNRSTATSFAVIGISGIGKSTAIENILLVYPQVITHTDYEYNGISTGYLKQIVWLKIECPFNGSRGTLCKNFFEAVDCILGTDYYRTFVKQRMNESDLIDKMAHVAALHCIGVLVFDEIQRMQKGEEGQKTMNFFVELHNKLGVPQIFIGTYKSIDLFTPLLANARRASTMGATFFDRMQKDKKWEYFLSKLWRYQWLKEQTELTDEIIDLFYNETQGITDLVINLFIQAQLQAIASRKEQLTPQIIKQAANKNLKLLKPMIDALRMGDKAKLKKYEDLKPEWVDVNQFIKNLPDTVSIEGEVLKEHEKAIGDAKEFVQYVSFAQNLGLSKEEAVKVVSRILENDKNKDSYQINKQIAEAILYESKKVQSKKSAKKKRTKYENKELLHLIGLKALNKKKNIEEELKKIGIVGSFNEFIS
jgi:hypothetical protein